MIKVENISKQFKNRMIFKDINLELQEGQIYGFVGHNGCGKSVLFKIICGFLNPTSGCIIVDDRVLGKDIDYIEDLGVMIETPSFLEYLSALDNLKYLASIKNIISEKEILETLKLVNLDASNKERVKNYSLGMRQRLAIAQAIMEDQKYLVFDEIFNGLDKNGRRDMKELLLELKKRNKTILITSHIDGDIEDLADEIYEFNDLTLEKI